MKPGNKAVACFNLAFSFLKKGKTGDMFQFLGQLAELESLVTPDMAVYGNLVKSGFSSLCFKNDPLFLKKLESIEDVISLTFESKKTDEELIDPFEYNEDLKNAEEQKEVIRTTYLSVRKVLETLKNHPEASKESQSPILTMKNGQNRRKSQFSKSSAGNNRSGAKKLSIESKFDGSESKLSSVKKDSEYPKHRIIILDQNEVTESVYNPIKSSREIQAKEKFRKAKLNEKLKSVIPSTMSHSLEKGQEPEPEQEIAQSTHRSNSKRSKTKKEGWVQPSVNFSISPTPSISKNLLDINSTPTKGLSAFSFKGQRRCSSRAPSMLAVERLYEGQLGLTREMEDFFSETYYEFLAILEKEPTNVPIIFYLAVLSRFVKTPAHQEELFELVNAVYSLNYKGRGYYLMDFYHTRLKNLKKRGTHIIITEEELS